MNLLLRRSHRELTNRFPNRALGPVQDPDVVAKDDGLAPDRDFGVESIR